MFQIFKQIIISNIRTWVQKVFSFYEFTLFVKRKSKLDWCGKVIATKYFTPSSFHNSLNSATFDGFRPWDTFSGSCHSISFRIKPGLWLGHSKTCLFFFYPFSGGLAGELWIIVLLHDTSFLDISVNNWWLDVFPQEFIVKCGIYDSTLYMSTKCGRSTIFDGPVKFTPDLMWYTAYRKLGLSLVSPEKRRSKAFGKFSGLFGLQTLQWITAASVHEALCAL